MPERQVDDAELILLFVLDNPVDRVDGVGSVTTAVCAEYSHAVEAGARCHSDVSVPGASGATAGDDAPDMRTVSVLVTTSRTGGSCREVDAAKLARLQVCDCEIDTRIEQRDVDPVAGDAAVRGPAACPHLIRASGL